MNSKILWKAKKFQKNKSNLFKYEKFLFSKYKFKITQNYNTLLRWSIKNPKKFWSSVWDFTGVQGIKSEKIEKSKIFYKNKFLKNSKLNFAENLLSKNDNSKAITFINESGIKKNRTWKELNRNVDKLIVFFKSIKFGRYAAILSFSLTLINLKKVINL